MKQNKVAIVVLVIIVVLFILGLGAGVFRDKGDEDDDLSMSKAQTLQKRWIGSLDKVMKPFRRSLDSRRLDPRATCRTGDRSYRLTDETECNIPIAAASTDGGEVENADITVETQNVSVELAYYNEDKDSGSTRGMRVSTGIVKTEMEAFHIDRIKPLRVPQKDLEPSLELTVVYLPEGEKNEPNDTMKVEGAVRLTVLEKGGTLRLKCKGCNGEEKRVIDVKLE